MHRDAPPRVHPPAAGWAATWHRMSAPSASRATRSGIGAAPMPPLSRWRPRCTWALLHASGFLLLDVGGGWPDATDGSWRFAALILLVAALYARASFTDPGYVETRPRRAVDEGLKESLLLTRGCMHCGALQRARTKHCHDCGRCVRRMDHHCWWLGNCVGARNHCSFVAFLSAQTALLAATLYCAAAAAWRPQPRYRPGGLFQWAAIAGAILLCVVAVLASTTLLVFQASRTAPCCCGGRAGCCCGGGARLDHPLLSWRPASSVPSL